MRSPALATFLWSRGAIWLGAILAFLWFEPNRHPLAGRWDGPELHELGWAVDVWARWDSSFFLQIAESGYERAEQAAFFPAYPALVGLAGRLLLGHYVLAGVVVSLACALGAFVLLERLAEDRLGADGARRAVLYLAVFPTSLFLGAVYAESLFLLLALAAFALAERGRFLAAGVAAGACLLTRPTGLALLAGVAVLAWPSARALARLAVALPIGALYPLLLWRELGDPWAFARAQDLWHRELSPLGPLGGIWDGLRSGWAGVRTLATGADTPPFVPAPGSTELHVAAVNLEALGFLVLFAALAVIAWRRLGAAYGTFAAASLAIPLSVPAERFPLLSLPRFGLVVFPFFLALAIVGGRSRVHTPLVVVSSLLLGLFVARWALWQWVA